MNKSIPSASNVRYSIKSRHVSHYGRSDASPHVGNTVNCLALLGIIIGSFLCCGCKPKVSDDARIQYSIVCETTSLSGDTPTKSVIHKRLIAMLRQATTQSVKIPQLGAVVLWGAPDKPRVEFWWIQDHPSADGLILRWPSNPQGTYFPVPDDILREFRNDKTNEEVVVYPLGIPLKKQIANGLQLPAIGIEAALAKDGRAISSFITCDSFLPSSIAATQGTKSF